MAKLNEQHTTKVCLYPKYIKNRKYVSNKKNGGNVPHVKDKRVLAVPIGCGYCIECKKQKARDYQVRLNEEIRERKNGKFVTFTFSNESLEKLEELVKEKMKKKILATGDNDKKLLKKYNYKLSGYGLKNECAVIAVRRFLERWRADKGTVPVRWFATELGQTNTERLHIHGIIFTDESNDYIKNKWKYGTTFIGDYVNERTIGYITKYISKVDEKHPNYKSRILCSKGLGKGYFKREDFKNNKFNGDKTREYYQTRSGIKLALPIYYRNKIYNEDEREKLWLNKLDIGDIYVLGKKIKNKEQYLKVLKTAQEDTTKLGYYNPKIWEEDRYKEEFKNLNNTPQGG